MSSVVEEEFRTKSPAERPELKLWYDMNDDQIWILFEHWGARFPDKDIVVAFQDSNCVYDFADQAELEYYNGTTIFLHPTGKNFIKMIFIEHHDNINHREGRK